GEDIATVTFAALFHEIADSRIGDFQFAMYTQSLAIFRFEHDDTIAFWNGSISKVAGFKFDQMFYPSCANIESGNFNSIFRNIRCNDMWKVGFVGDIL